MKPTARRLARALVVAFVLLVTASVVAIAVSQTAWFKTWLRGYVVRQASQYVNGAVSIERLGGNLLHGVELDDIRVSSEGEPAVTVGALRVEYDAFDMLRHGLTVRSVRIDRPIVHLRRRADGWTLSHLLKSEQGRVKSQGGRAEDRATPGPIAIDALEIHDGSIVLDEPLQVSGVTVPRRFDQVTLRARASCQFDPAGSIDRLTVDVARASFLGSEPPLALEDLSGRASVDGEAVLLNKIALRTAGSSLSIDGAVRQYTSKPAFALHVSSDRLSMPEIARLVPSLTGVGGLPTFDVKLDGPPDRLGVDLDVHSTAGHLTGRVIADARARSIAGGVSVRHLDLAPILNDRRQTSDISADATLDVRADDSAGARGTVSLKAPRIRAAGYTFGPLAVKARLTGRRVDVDASATAYGADVTAAGPLVFPDRRVELDFRGQARRVDLRNLPRDLEAPPAATELNADYHVVASIPLSGSPGGDGRGHAAVPLALTGDARFLPSHAFGAEIAEGGSVGIAVGLADLAYRADVTLSNLNLQRVGEELDIPGLSADRYASAIDGHIVANGHGTTPQTFALAANGMLTDAALSGARLRQLAFDAVIANDTAHVKLNGAFSDLDPAVLSGNAQVTGALGGRLDVDAEIRNVSNGVTLDGIDATARFDVGASTVSGLEIERGTLDGDYRDSTTVIRALTVEARDLNIQADGTLALGDRGESNLTLHAESPGLGTIGQLLDQPMAGIARVDATVTGNRRLLRAGGRVTATGLDYEGIDALAASSDFTAELKNFEFAGAAASATTHATLITVGGQTLDELTVKTDLAARELAFDATARDRERSLSAAGAVLFAPKLENVLQEVHLKRLDVRAPGAQWQLAPGAQPIIEFDKNTTAVRDLQLVDGNQRISADGAFGQPGDRLEVKVDNVDLAALSGVVSEGADALLHSSELSGRLNSSIVITGSRSDPSVSAGFGVEQGGFTQFRYDTLAGTASYRGLGIDFDVRLQQGETTWITAKGYAPVAASASRSEYDAHIESSAIDLGVIQPFTTALAGIKGTLRATMALTGPAGDPRPLGSVTIENGSFTVVPTGVAYSALAGRVDLEPQRIHIDQLRLLDSRGKPLTIAGDLAIRERELGGVAIAVKSSDFEIIANKMGRLRINSDLRIAGELRSPRIDGDLGLVAGQINLDPILAEVSDAPGTAPSVFDALQMYVHMTAPNALVVKANDVTMPGSPIGLGTVNVTLGADLYASKAPWDEVRLLGTINTVRGSYDFQGRRFTILRDGNVRFNGLSNLDAALNVKAERVIQAVTATVNIRGTLQRPELALTSTPPLNQGDILSLIVFNQPINELGEGQQVSLAARAQYIALGAATGQIAQSIGNKLGLDTLELNVAPQTGPQITVGQQVGPNLYVKVQQGLTDQNQTDFILEYELTKWLRFRTNFVQGSTSQAQLFQRMQGSGLDLLFFFSY